MESVEEYRLWPVEELATSPEVVSTVSDHRGLLVVMHAGDERLELRWPPHGVVLACRMIDERFRSRTWTNFSGEPGRTFYQVTNSRFLDEFLSESLGVGDDYRAVHYAILTDDDCIDVLATEGPVVTRSRTSEIATG